MKNYLDYLYRRFYMEISKFDNKKSYRVSQQDNS